MFKTISAKYPGICRRCHTSIRIGDKIRYGGPGRTYHLASACHAAEHQAPTDHQIAEQAYALAETGDETQAAAVYSTRRDQRGKFSSSYTRFSSGAEIYTNKNGRCEDAPCCGCCS